MTDNHWPSVMMSGNFRLAPAMNRGQGAAFYYLEHFLINHKN